MERSGETLILFASWPVFIGPFLDRQRGRERKRASAVGGVRVLYERVDAFCVATVSAVGMVFDLLEDHRHIQ